MKNRYDDILRKHNQDILSVMSYDPVFFRIGAWELKKVYKKGGRVLEIGCGEGDSARYMLEMTPASLDLLDISPRMISICKKNLHSYAKRTCYICDDALAYLERAKPYDVVFSAWTVHNFTQVDKKKLFKAIYKKLRPGGTCILMDKIYPPGNWKGLFEREMRRYGYLSPKVAKAIIAHEKADASDNYRMDEKKLVPLLKKVGFRTIKVVDRLERNAIIVMQK